ncbi:MAG: AMP-binding protein [Salibacter sp.]|uniref:AMP-binding protein n=1 Tax=Salibacter sp. TaxID=2010995 RepID=UPI00286FDBDD|nr:AMP-binding protein [Salibacter sp.]MDR9398388.1 AMP-binding protein [Salibacter sp.]
MILKVGELTIHSDLLEESISQLSAQQLSIMPQWKQNVFTFLREWFDENDYIRAQTSGSTGKPKTIKLSKESMRNSAKMTNEFFDLGNGQNALLCMDARFIAGKMMIVRSLQADMNLTIVEPQSNLSDSLQTAYDFSAMVPLQVKESIQALDSIKTLIIGGGPVDADLESKLQEISTKCYSTYGMTETTSHVAVRAINGSDRNEYYNAMQGVSFSLSKEKTLVIDAPHLNVKSLKTNDVVELQENSFKWIGRSDFTVNSGGVKLQPESIEKKISQFVNVPLYLTGTPDEKLGEKLIMYVESQENEAIKKGLENAFQTLDQYEIPKEVIYRKSLERTKSGKIKRIVY